MPWRGLYWHCNFFLLKHPKCTLSLDFKSKELEMLVYFKP